MVNTFQPAAEQMGSREVMLVIPSTGNVTQLQQFIRQVRETFQVTRLKVNGSWKETQVTLALESPVPAMNIMNRLLRMAEVEGVKEKKTKKIRDESCLGILVTLDSGDGY